MDKVKISAVSYLNTTPLIYGIKNSPILLQSIDLSKDMPAECARKLLEGEVDLGLVPVAIIPLLKESHIVSDYCIGADGEVNTVLLLSDVELNEIETIYLDYQSRTSVALCQVLCRELWKIEPAFKPAKPGFENQLNGNSAGVIIGDRTFNLGKEFAFRFDLAAEWKKLTGLPFVFAAWVANKKLDNRFIELFNTSLAYGLSHIDEAIADSKQQSIPGTQLKEYLTRYIQFDLDADKKKAMNLFLSKL